LKSVTGFSMLVRPMSIADSVVVISILEIITFKVLIPFFSNIFLLLIITQIIEMGIIEDQFTREIFGRYSVFSILESTNLVIST